MCQIGPNMLLKKEVLCYRDDCADFHRQKSRRSFLARENYSWVIRYGTMQSINLSSTSINGWYPYYNKEYEGIQDGYGSLELDMDLALQLVNDPDLSNTMYAMREKAINNRGPIFRFDEFKKLFPIRYSKATDENDIKKIWDLVIKSTTKEDLHDALHLNLNAYYLERFRVELQTEMDMNSPTWRNDPELIKVFQAQFSAKISNHLTSSYQALYRLKFNVSAFVQEYRLFNKEFSSHQVNTQASELINELLRTLPSNATVLNLSDFGTEMSDGTYRPYPALLENLLFARIPPQINTVILPSAWKELDEWHHPVILWKLVKQRLSFLPPHVVEIRGLPHDEKMRGDNLNIMLPKTVAFAWYFYPYGQANQHYNVPDSQGNSSFLGFPPSYNEAFEHGSQNKTDPNEKLLHGMHNLLLHYLSNHQIPTTQNHYFLAPWRCTFRTNRIAVEALEQRINWQAADPYDVLFQLKSILPANENGGLQSRINFMQLKVRDWMERAKQNTLVPAQSSSLHVGV